MEVGAEEAVAGRRIAKAGMTVATIVGRKRNVGGRRRTGDRAAAAVGGPGSTALIGERRLGREVDTEAGTAEL